VPASTGFAGGARVQYFDHHDAGELPASDLFVGHIDTAADVCTSILVDRAIGGRHRAWAVAAAFGDNLPAAAGALAKQAGLGEREQQVLMNLGQCLNYNGYGDRLEDLHFDPVALYRAVSRYESPFEFAEVAPELRILNRAMEADLQWLHGLQHRERYLPHLRSGRRRQRACARRETLSCTGRLPALWRRRGTCGSGHQ
jgi:hypothetical protein